MQRLQPELDQIRDEQIMTFTRYVLEKAPTYFWTVPSSSSGKYHPPQSNGEGGLFAIPRLSCISRRSCVMSSTSLARCMIASSPPVFSTTS